MVRVISVFFVAFGIVLGGALMAGVAALITRQPPFDFMAQVSEDLKFWAIIAAIGGTFEALKGLHEGVLIGHISALFRQILYILSAFFGANTASYMLLTLLNGKGMG
ncbi:Sporulation membrane protein ytrH [[Clostridium] ultunense Esp]|uniref:YtrH family sporulation protein n=1 Tax=Thermicanus aegyptius TaxID=94009 RepID=UPI0002B70D45|nr:YtrH family sporulation protein [Thermicanus aegyptius]CCQ97756.1 Sporulation membrane protein ytrH [[Clostridium] ultunense Esp]